MKFLISGGGTGGHIFPAVSIANALREAQPDCEILFVGALGRMEMERVPAAGYKIVGLPVQGFDRKHLLRNIPILWNLLKSMRQVKRVIREFRPDVAVGVGGYASGAAMKVAARMGIPVLLQEQNGFAGVTNKLLKNDAAKICVAYEGMERFFPADKIILTGNPVRQNLTQGNRADAYKEFGFSPDKKTLLIIGGSLGARTINNSVKAHLKELVASGIQILWQTGKFYIDDCRKAAEPFAGSGLIVTDFVARMDLAYAMADLVVSRAGASSISELCLLGKPSILVPSPNVAEDHQTHNAMALVNKHAAVLVKDVDAQNELIDNALRLINDDAQLADLAANVSALAQHDSARRIADEVIKLVKSPEPMKKHYLYKINVVLLVLLLPALVSSLLQELLRGANLHCLTNSTLTIIHLIVCVPMLLFVGVHLWANCGKITQWFAKIRRQKWQTQLLFWFSVLTFVSGIAATVVYFLHGHTPVGGIHGKLGFVALALMLWHTYRRLKWYKKN